MTQDQRDSEYAWTSRNMQPVTVFYVILVFLVFILAAQFIFHSPDAVKALFITLVGWGVAMIPSLLARTEYRLSSQGLEKRGLQGKAPKEFKEVFRWEELSRVKPTGNGFKFYKPIEDGGTMSRLWKLHFTDAYSGEFRAGGEARRRVTDELTRREIPIGRQRSPSSLPPDP